MMDNRIAHLKGKHLEYYQIEELEEELMAQGKLADDEIITRDNRNNWIIRKMVIENSNPQLEKAIINLPETGESSGDSNSNTVYSPTKTYSKAGEPPRRPYSQYNDENDKNDYIRNKGKRLPLEQIDKKLLIDDGRILNLTAHDPQKWRTVIDAWSQKVCREWDALNITTGATQMYNYLEKYLGESVRAMWEAYKTNCPQDFEQDLELGTNPYNFVNRIQIIVLGEQPNIGIGKQQVEAVRKLEQLQIRQWNYIKPFLQDYTYYTSLAGCTYDRTIGEKLFLKLPAPLGGIIHKKFQEQEKELKPAMNNITIRVKFIVDQLVEECTRITIGRQLKGGNSFCRNIYTPQIYGGQENAKRNYKRNKYRPTRSVSSSGSNNYTSKKQYYLRKSTARKPYLNKDKHVRKYDRRRDYKAKLSCFSCGSTDHLVKNCNGRQNIHNKESVLVECVNEDLLHVDETISDTETIYSIVSITEQGYQDQISSDEEDNNQFTNSMIEFDRKCRESYEDILEESQEIDMMLSSLQNWKI